MLVLALFGTLLTCIAVFIHFVLSGEWYEASKLIIPAVGVFMMLQLRVAIGRAARQ